MCIVPSSEFWAAWAQRLFEFDADTTGRVLVSLGLLVGVFVVRWVVLALVYRRRKDIKVRYRWKKTTQYIAAGVTLVLVGRVWFEGIQSLATYLGILSAGLAIALKELVANLVGWAFVLWRRPFEVGDRIQIGDVSGDVIDLRIFQFTLLEIGNWVNADQSTGRIIHVNNGRIFTDNLANYSKGFQYIWNEVDVLVTFESGWRKAKLLLAEIARRPGQDLSQAAEEKLRKAARKFMIFYKTLTPTVYTSVEDCGVLLRVRYLCDPRKRRSTQEAVWEDVLDAFAAIDDIDFAYPTRRFYDNVVEGKPGARAERAPRDPGSIKSGG